VVVVGDIVVVVVVGDILVGDRGSAARVSTTVRDSPGRSLLYVYAYMYMYMYIHIYICTCVTKTSTVDSTMFRTAHAPHVHLALQADQSEPRVTPLGEKYTAIVKHICI
jgi:hypothetical protein